eukprot:293153-Chlamydomonas_euryale.AAC.7
MASAPTTHWLAGSSPSPFQYTVDSEALKCRASRPCLPWAPTTFCRPCAIGARACAPAAPPPQPGCQHRLSGPKRSLERERERESDR